ncbi:Rrf2 family transcriptional regulator [uncultured Eubacterium sp.]|uniref:RrF2 family transcriptional regulator n=1 Tax=uncultured Eubacterium sp. TaxID=165185 RepID=UPI0025EEDCFC|nr:RrF2 family transcriptional regulator [uncultured Eubacterium sp.]
MMISTKGRYALSIMLDLAAHDDGNYISLKDISERLEISMKYLEAIIAKLSKGGLVDSARGKSGGYKLNRKVEEYSVGEILVLTEKTLAPVACVNCDACKKEESCLTRPMWNELNEIIMNFLNSKTLADLL